MKIGKTVAVVRVEPVEDPAPFQAATGGLPELTSVLIVDDHEAFRSAATELVTSTPGVSVAGQASSGEAAIEQVALCAPDIVLMDVRMPGMGGLEAARRIATTNPETLVVLLSTHARAGAVETSKIVDKRELTPDFLRSLASTLASPSHGGQADAWIARPPLQSGA